MWVICTDESPKVVVVATLRTFSLEETIVATWWWFIDILTFALSLSRSSRSILLHKSTCWNSSTKHLLVSRLIGAILLLLWLRPTSWQIAERKSRVLWGPFPWLEHWTRDGWTFRPNCTRDVWVYRARYCFDLCAWMATLQRLAKSRRESFPLACEHGRNLKSRQIWSSYLVECVCMVLVVFVSKCICWFIWQIETRWQQHI